MKRDYSAGDMERIQKGLEDFLEREVADIQKKHREPRLYDLREDAFEEDFRSDYIWEDDAEENARREDNSWNDMRGGEILTEDWDSKEHRREIREYKKEQKRQQKQQKQAGKPHAEEPQLSPKEKKRQQKLQEKQQKKQKRRKKIKRFLFAAVLILALLAGGLYYLAGNVYDKMNYHEIESVVSAPVEDEGVINILLIGNDSRTNDESGRSDAMILLSINSETKQMYMTSLLRDMYVEIPGYKNNRLNAAYSYGGAELLMETIELNFDITVNRYVLVNFEAFANLVDAVGGIDLELSSKEVEYVNAYLWEYNILTDKPEGTDYMDTSLSGVVHLNGPQALAYTRNRYLGTDFGRTERQRKVLSAVIKKAPVALLTNGKELIEGIMPNLTTNLTQAECYKLGIQGARALSYEVIPASIPMEGTYKDATIRGMSVLEVDFEANRQFLQDNIYGKKE